jgi:3-dehydroquinate dehydratase-2
MDTIWVLNGPGLSLLGQREPAIYGSDTLETIIGELRREADEVHGVELVAHQSNHEGVLLDWLCEADASGARAVLLNVGGLSHTSVALHDMIRGIKVPVIAVHLSNTAACESFRQRDLVASAARGSVIGFAALSYRLALTAAMSL